MPSPSQSTGVRSTVVSPASHPPLRKSFRVSKPPIWMQDYVVHTKQYTCAYPIAQHVNYDQLSSDYIGSIVAYSVVFEPRTFAEASKDPQWVNAMKAEISALEDNKTWSIVDRPPDKIPDGFSSQGEYKKALSFTSLSMASSKGIGSNLALIQQVRKDLQNKYKMKDLGELKYFLGIEFSRPEKGIHICQRKYALELVLETWLAGAKPIGTPLEFNHKLTSIEFDRVVNNKTDADDQKLEDKGGYQRIVGRLLYLTMTRPNISFVVQVLSQHMHAPKQYHM
ncbi:uncharacterized protein [Nicotiana sylvestris]|uniref:uncharacterized protein n=1 Tax=Nicotiana sylvestris TaxID=4096 RepID=UPI00388CACE5